MDKDTKARVLELLERPLASLTVREALFLACVADRWADDTPVVADLLPELAPYLED